MAALLVLVAVGVALHQPVLIPPLAASAALVHGAPGPPISQPRNLVGAVTVRRGGLPGARGGRDGPGGRGCRRRAGSGRTSVGRTLLTRLSSLKTPEHLHVGGEDILEVQEQATAFVLPADVEVFLPARWWSGHGRVLPADVGRSVHQLVGGRDDPGLLPPGLRRPGCRLRANGESPRVGVVRQATTCPASSAAIADHRSRSVAPAAGSSNARSVTRAPSATPRPIGSRPSRRTVRTIRGFAFAFGPPPLARAASIAARSATRARSTPDTSLPFMPGPTWCSRGPGAQGLRGAARSRRTTW
ncbi:HPP family protein [Streptomyces sp. NPDC002516]